MMRDHLTGRIAASEAADGGSNPSPATSFLEVSMSGRSDLNATAARLGLKVKTKNTIEYPALDNLKFQLAEALENGDAILAEAIRLQLEHFTKVRS